MNRADLINGAFEAIGAAMTVVNIARLLRDRQVRGFIPHLGFFYTGWGLWNLFYYPHLSQWWSFFGTVAIVISNGLFTGLALYYARRKHE